MHAPSDAVRMLGPNQEASAMTSSADELEQTYRRIYRRLTLGMFVAYAVVFGVAVTVLVSGSATSWWLEGAASTPRAASAHAEARP
jgi:hypothetical protein